MSKQQTFDEWYKDWTGSDVKCENTDIRAAWDHQEKRIQFLEKAFENLKLQLENKQIDSDIDAKKITDLKKENLKLQIYMLEVQKNLEDVEQLKKEKSLYEMEVNQIAMANQQWQLKCAGLEGRISKVKQIVQHSIGWVNDNEDEYTDWIVGGVLTSYRQIQDALENKDA